MAERRPFSEWVEVPMILFWWLMGSWARGLGIPTIRQVTITGPARPGMDKSRFQGSQGTWPRAGLGVMLIVALSPLLRCWVSSPTVHRVLVMGYGGLTFLFNLVVLACALCILCRLRAREKALRPRACRDTVMVLGLTVLLGTTWALAFFSISVFLLPQLFLFSIFNSLYGRLQELAGRWALGGASHWGALGQGVDDD